VVLDSHRLAPGAPLPPRVRELTEVLTFLGVHADHRLVRALMVGDLLVEILKLGVPIRVLMPSWRPRERTGPAAHEHRPCYRDLAAPVELGHLAVDLVVPDEVVDAEGDEREPEPNADGIAALHREPVRLLRRHGSALPPLHPLLRGRGPALGTPRRTGLAPGTGVGICGVWVGHLRQRSPSIVRMRQ